MADLLPSLSSDEEDNLDADEESLNDDINEDFEFGGILVRFRHLNVLFLFVFNGFSHNLALFPFLKNRVKMEECRLLYGVAHKLRRGGLTGQPWKF